jgi:hypothetical protein
VVFSRLTRGVQKAGLWLLQAALKALNDIRACSNLAAFEVKCW